MSYYDSIDDDIKRAKEILEKGKLQDDDFYPDVPPDLKARLVADAGHIFAVDRHAAYKLLESFVAEIARLREALLGVDGLIIERNRLRDLVDAAGPGVCELALWHKQKHGGAQ